MKKKTDKNKILYLNLILKISEEVGIFLEESKKIVGIALATNNSIKISFKDVKKEIICLLTINIFSLICKL